jgi:hypothetical protein
MYTFSANANVLSANFPFSVLPAGWGGGMGQAAETESTLALAENVYVNLPTPARDRIHNTKLECSITQYTRLARNKHYLIGSI